MDNRNKTITVTNYCLFSVKAIGLLELILFPCVLTEVSVMLEVGLVPNSHIGEL